MDPSPRNWNWSPIQGIQAIRLEFTRDDLLIVHPDIIYIYILYPYAPWCWNIYQHLSHQWPILVGKYTIHGAYGIYTRMSNRQNYCNIFLKSSQPIGDDPNLCMALNLTCKYVFVRYSYNITFYTYTDYTSVFPSIMVIRWSFIAVELFEKMGIPYAPCIVYLPTFGPFMG